MHIVHWLTVFVVVQCRDRVTRRTWLTASSLQPPTWAAPTCSRRGPPPRALACNRHRRPGTECGWEHTASGLGGVGGRWRRKTSGWCNMAGLSFTDSTYLLFSWCGASVILGSRSRNPQVLSPLKWTCNTAGYVAGDNSMKLENLNPQVQLSISQSLLLQRRFINKNYFITFLNYIASWKCLVIGNWLLMKQSN